MKENKILQVFLVLLVLLVWSGVFYRAYHALTEKNIGLSRPDTAQAQDPLKYPVLPDQEFNADLLRQHDPFRAFRATAGVQGRIPDDLRLQKNQTVPAYMLKGIVWDPKDPKAILVKSRIFSEKDTMKLGETAIVTSGQVLDNGKVLEITENYVIISIGAQKYKLWSDLWQPIQ